MESRAFIRTAAALITKIEADDPEARAAVQKEIHQAFTGLQNPTLPSTYKLRDAALAAGYVVDQKVLGRLQQAEAVWS